MTQESNLNNKIQWWHLLLIVAVVFIVFGNSLAFDFVWDDNILILKTDAYRNFSLKEILFTPVNKLEYLPVRDISYCIDFLLWGETPSGFHLTNVFFYVLNCLMVYFLTLEIVNLIFSKRHIFPAALKNQTALFTTLFFAVHPLHSEPVSFVMCRNVLLSGFFFFTSCYFFLRFLRAEKNKWRLFYAVSLICFGLGLFSKSTIIILPLIFSLFLLFNQRDWEKNGLSLLPFFLLSGVVFFIAKKIASDANFIVVDHAMVFGALTAGSRIAVSLQIPFFYVMKLIIPINLSAEYVPEFSRSFLHMMTLSLLIVSILVSVAAYGLRKKHPELLFSFLWFIIALIPVLNIFLTNPIVADRYVYYSSYAFFLPFTFLILRIKEALPQKLLFILFTIILLLLSSLTIRRNKVWKNESVLWENTIKTSPKGASSYNNLGALYFSQGNYEKAFDVFQQLKEVHPSTTAYEYHRGLQLFNSGDYNSVVRLLKDACKTMNNGSLTLNCLLGETYEKLGNVEDAMRCYMNILESNEIDIGNRRDFALKRLGVLRNSMSDEINMMRSRALANKTDFNARIQLAIALDRAGLFAEACMNYVALENLAGAHWALYNNLANIYKKTEEYKKAAMYYQKSIELNPGNIDALNNLGLVFKKLGKYDLSIKAFKDAMQLDNNFEDAPYNLAVLYFHLGDKEQALYYFNSTINRFPRLKGMVSPYLGQLSKE